MVKFTQLQVRKITFILLTQKALYEEELPQNSLHQTVDVSHAVTLK